MAHASEAAVSTASHGWLTTNTSSQYDPASQAASTAVFNHSVYDPWRETPLRHRYVHGGFHDADTRFSYYFPEPDAYEGRFFQHVTPVPQHEHLVQSGEGQNKVSFACSSGGYFVETNGGGPDVIDD